MAWTQKAFDASNKLNGEQTRLSFEMCARTLEDSLNRMEKILESNSYTTGELRDIRASLLRTVRDRLDPQIGPMPQERHY